jgi:hypothetical protein
MHDNMHQLIAGLNAVAFNVSNNGRSVGRFGGQGNYGGGYGGRSRGRGRPFHRGCGFPPTRMYGGFPSPGGFAGGRFPGYMPQTPPPGPPPGFPGTPQGHGVQPYHTPRIPGIGAPGLSPTPFHTPQVQQQQQPFSNLVKCHANWNMCYSCGFDVADGHMSMSCPAHLRKVSHGIYFTRQNAQRYIDLGPCCTRIKHKTQLPTM